MQLNVSPHNTAECPAWERWHVRSLVLIISSSPNKDFVRKTLHGYVGGEDLRALGGKSQYA